MTQTSPIDQAAGKRLVVEDSVQVDAPVAEVYSRWTDFTHFPEFMSNVEEVRAVGNGTYHWVARIFGIKQEWDAEVTDRTPNQRLAWHSTTGAYNGGTVNFSSLGDSKTEVRVRMEYTPPAGQLGAAADTLTKTTQKEVKEDLKNFKKLVTGKKVSAESLQSSGQMEEDITEGVAPQGPAGALLVAAGAAGIGAGAAYFLGKSLRETSGYKAAASPVKLPWALASWASVGLSAASVVTSASFRFGKQRRNALFVGQWAPTFLGMGILYRLIGDKRVSDAFPTSVISWSFFGATLGSILSAITLHLRGKRNEGLFVGQWAPTFIGAAALARLLDRAFTR